MRNPVGTGPYKLEQWVRSSKIVLEANPDYRGFVWDFTPTAARRRQARRADEGQEDAAGRPRRDLDHGGGPGAAARVPERRARPHEHGRAARAERARRRQAAARARGEGRAALAHRRSGDLATRTGTCRIRSSAASTKEKIALRRAMAMAYDVAEEIRSCATARRSRRATRSRRASSATMPNWKSGDQATTRPAPTRCSTSSATRSGADGWRTLPDGKPLVDPLRVAAGHAGPPAGRDRGRSRSTRSACAWKCQQGQVPRAPEAREAVQAA